MKGKILIIEDVREMADLIALYLSKEGMEIVSAETAESALEKLENFTPDLVVLDLNLPGIDGFEFLNHFRKNYRTPVIIVSARDADEDIIAGLGYGADEFVTKPFSPRVLVARIRALLRRVGDASAQNVSDKTLCFGDFVLDYNSFTLKRLCTTNGTNGANARYEPRYERVNLSAKEYAVLAYLTENARVPLLPEQIYSAVWKTEFGDLSAVAVYIQRLRKKIEEDSTKPVFIRTVFGMGYAFYPNGSDE